MFNLSLSLPNDNITSTLSEKRLRFNCKVLNLGFFLWGALKQPSISSYLLYIFIANCALYTTYYIAMKLVHQEKMTIQVL